MDIEFDRRWRNGVAPFDGLTITLRDFVSLPLLQPMVLSVVESLFASRPDAPLYHLLDWHEHDGFLTVARPSSWQEVYSLITSEANLVERFRLGDSYVREAFFPGQRDYYLRLYVPGIFDNPFHRHDAPSLVHYGNFDVTGPESIITKIAATLQAGEEGTVEILPAKTFFDHR